MKNNLMEEEIENVSKNKIKIKINKKSSNPFAKNQFMDRKGQCQRKL